jgi:MFS family permease
LKEVSMTIYGLNMDGLGTDTRQAQVKRAMLGALYGLLGGAAFVLMAAFIDIWLHPDLPLTVNWSAFTLRLPLISLGLVLVGAVTCWWHEAWQGLLSGAVVASALALVAALFTSQVDTGMKIIVLIFTLIPIAAMTLPVAYVLRWFTERHARALYMNRSGARIAGLILLMIAVGLGPGYFMKSSGRAIEATRLIHNFLQDLALARAEKNPLARVAGVSERRETPYQMYSTRSETSSEAFDIHVEYEDNYKLLCTVILYPGRDPYFSGCQVRE